MGSGRQMSRPTSSAEVESVRPSEIALRRIYRVFGGMQWNGGCLTDSSVHHWLAPKRLCHGECYHSRAGIAGNLLALCHRSIQFCLAHESVADDPRPKRGGELHRQSHVGMTIAE